MNMTTRLKKLPEFKTPEEEDEFWQTHSPLDYEHEVVETPKRAFRYPTMKNLTVRLDEDTLRNLQEVAKSTGVRPTALAREMIRKSLRSRRTRSSAVET
jgi:predicted DNA binding CopG/RHH family protein